MRFHPLTFPLTEDESNVTAIKFELAVLSGLQNKSKHIMQLVGYTEAPEMTILTKYYPNGSLAAKLRDHAFAVDGSFIERLAMGLVNGMCIVHQHDMVHYDLKPQNVLLDENMDPVLSDFVIANLVGYDMDSNSRLVRGLSNPNQQGFTPAYAAPELYRRSGVTTQLEKSVDVYAWGITLLDIMTRVPAWTGEDGERPPVRDFESALRFDLRVYRRS